MTIKVISTSEQPKPAEAAPAATPKEVASEKSEAAPAEAEAPAEISDDSETPETHEKEEAEPKGEAEESEEEGGEGKPEQPKKKGGFQKRVDKLNKRIADKEREAEYWRQKALNAKPQETKPVEAKNEPVSIAGKPKADNYASHDEYLEALTDWKVDQREKAKETMAKEAAAKTEVQTKVESYQKGVKELAAKISDYNEVIEDCDIVITPTIQKLILDSDNGPELSYHLAKNPMEFERISKLDAVSAARELGRFEAKHLSAPEEKQETQKITNAPAPIKPVGSGGSASPKKTIWDADKMSQAEYEALRAKQLAKKRA